MILEGFKDITPEKFTVFRWYLGLASVLLYRDKRRKKPRLLRAIIRLIDAEASQECYVAFQEKLEQELMKDLGKRLTSSESYLIEKVECELNIKYYQDYLTANRDLAQEVFEEALQFAEGLRCKKQQRAANEVEGGKTENEKK